LRWPWPCTTGTRGFRGRLCDETYRVPIGVLRQSRAKKGKRTMFERFTERARLAVVAAQKEARNLNHHDIGTGVILLALTDEGTGTSARALASLGITQAAVGQQLREIVTPGQPLPPLVQIPFSAPAKQALELSSRQAETLGHAKAGSGHLLLGLIEAGHNQATQILTGLGTDPGRVRQQVIELLRPDDNPR
jgi:ATP-dependent Clp protease ATP-binding subunit ClpC